MYGKQQGQPAQLPTETKINIYIKYHIWLFKWIMCLKSLTPIIHSNTPCFVRFALYIVISVYTKTELGVLKRVDAPTCKWLNTVVSYFRNDKNSSAKHNPKFLLICSPVQQIILCWELNHKQLTQIQRLYFGTNLWN
jgi:hypothetical protein